MKGVFYKVGFTVLIIAAVLGITGGVAMAASPPDNTVLGSIQQIVSDIWNTLTSSSSGLPAVNSKLNTLQASVDDLAPAPNEVALISTGNGTYMVGSGAVGGDVYERINDGIRHVSLTYYVPGLKTGDYFVVGSLFPSIEGPLTISLLTNQQGDSSGVLQGSLQFDSAHWKIQTWQYDGDELPIKVYFTFTETYPK